jgi:hypothetical protein
MQNRELLEVDRLGLKPVHTIAGLAEKSEGGEIRPQICMPSAVRRAGCPGDFAWCFAVFMVGLKAAGKEGIHPVIRFFCVKIWLYID